MWILYDLVFLLIAIIYLPIYLFRRRFHRGFGMRFGLLPRDIELNNPIWLHAVSVGEIISAKNLLKELRAAYPDKRFFISTVTPTGNKIARSLAGENDFVGYLPLDLSFIVRGVIQRIKPSLFIILETEFWPNLISYLHRKDIPIIVINGRISDRSFKGYVSIKFLLRPLLNKISLFCVQVEADAERLARLGVPAQRIQITGNMKFDIADYADLKKDYADLRMKLGLQFQEKLLVCGSTHPGEEEIILRVYQNLLKQFPQLKLLIAPRHPQRAKEIGNIVTNFGFGPLNISQLSGSPGEKTVFILDTIGELMDFYGIADIVFVGGSLIRKGGQNILEPAALGKPIIFGPYMFNFRDIADLFSRNKACLLARNKEELEQDIKDLLNNPSRARELGQRARELVLNNQGATARNLEHIKHLFPPARQEKV